MKKEENRAKIDEYIQGLVPLSRDLPDSTFQSYYNRSAMQGYGRNNTNEPIGGIMYGNHLKTFNVNPHVREGNPAEY